MMMILMDLDLPRFSRLVLRMDSFKAATKFSLIGPF